MEILSLGEKIKRKRKELNMTLKDLAGDRITPGQISLVESGRSNPSMDLLEYLAGNLNTTVEYLMESAESQAEKNCIYYQNVAESYMLGRDYEKAEKYVQWGLYYSEMYKLEYRKAKNLYLKAEISKEKGNLELAKEKYLEANQIFIETKNHEEVVYVLLNLGDISLKLKSFNSANNYLKQAEKAYFKTPIGDELLLGEIYYKMAEVYFYMGNESKAEEYCLLARDKFVKVYHKKNYAKELLEKSVICSEEENLNDAIQYSKKALQKFKDYYSENNIADMENRLGELFGVFNKLEESFKHLAIARELRRRNKSEKVVETLLNIAENYMKLRDLRSCEITLLEAGNYLDTADVKSIINYKLFMHKMYMIKELFNEAEDSLIEAFEIAEKECENRKAADIAIMISKFYIDSKRDIEAVKYLNKGVNILRGTGILDNQ